MLEVEAIHVRYGNVEALRGVSLSVGEAEFVGIIGPNGAGKTSLLLAIAGVLRPAAGAIRLRGALINGLAPERVVRSGIALVPEGRHIFGNLTVGDNLRLSLSSLSHHERKSWALDGVLDRFPILRERFQSSAAKMSGGEQQQLAIARALLCRPSLLLLDEPSLGLSPRMVDVIFDALHTLRDEGVTILLVEQNAERTVGIADRTYVLRSGSVVAETSADEGLNDAELSSTFFGPQ
jgi:branched-chain amino acid transport system ATP-binding protein